MTHLTRSQVAGHNGRRVRIKTRDGGRLIGKVESILTRTETHPHGIKVRLQSGDVGRVASLVTAYVPLYRTERVICDNQGFGWFPLAPGSRPWLTTGTLTLDYDD